MSETAYKVGLNEIVRLPRNATAALGARFDVRAFNNAVVLDGNMPLDVLAANVGEYLRPAAT